MIFIVNLTGGLLQVRKAGDNKMKKEGSRKNVLGLLSQNPIMQDVLTKNDPAAEGEDIGNKSRGSGGASLQKTSGKSKSKSKKDKKKVSQPSSEESSDDLSDDFNPSLKYSEPHKS